ncbi:MAG: hypothetical protein II988_04220 [Clostridia bacterium]|nr:hypothetical protein [Clostridia bacterium]MBQ3493607.1 hypothetical protein [Clostridia bacterium]MBQ3597004.1 hypothetical protein [Clostridia bacterium]
MAKKQGKIGKVIAYILILLIVVGAIGFLAYYTNGFTGGIKTFSVECNGKEVMTSSSGFEMTVNEPLTVKVKYTFGGENVSGYSVKVVPNKLAGKDFDFKVDEYLYSYQAEKDLTDGFDVEYGENTFTIKPKGNLTEILQAIYPNNVVEDCSQYSYENMFMLIVYSYDGESSVLLNFSVPEKVTGIELDKEVIVF